MSNGELFGGAAPGELRRRDLWSLSQKQEQRIARYMAGVMELQTELARVRELVEMAYVEAFLDNTGQSDEQAAGDAWMQSETKKRLDALSPSAEHHVINDNATCAGSAVTRDTLIALGVSARHAEQTWTSWKRIWRKLPNSKTMAVMTLTDEKMNDSMIPDPARTLVCLKGGHGRAENQTA